MEPQALKEILEKHKQWLADPDTGERANLRRADLRGADLRGANLRWADLSGANLSGADLRWADLRWADLSGANLSWADLRWANLREADLRRADLTRADLRGADLRRADLKVFHAGQYTAYIQNHTTRIGCQNHTNEAWRAFSDDEIAGMDSGALDWWNENKTIVFAIMDNLNKQEG